MQRRAPPASGTRAARAGERPAHTGRSRDVARCGRRSCPQHPDAREPDARAGPLSPRPSSAERTLCHLGFTEGETEAWKRALAEATGSAWERQLGGGAFSRGLPRAGRVPPTPSVPLGTKGPRAGKPTDGPGRPAAGGRHGPPARGRAAALDTSRSVRTQGGARGAHKGTRSWGRGPPRAVPPAAPGRFKSSGSQAQPPAPIPLPSTPGGWTGPVPVDSPSSLPPRDLCARGRSSSSLSPFKKIKQKVCSFSMHYFETWFPYLQNEDRNLNAYK